MADDSGAPPAKRQRADGNVSNVDQSVLLAAKDPEQWIANRRKNWPTKERIAQRKAEAEKRQQKSGERTESSSDQQPNNALEADALETTISEPPKRKPPICRYFLRGRCNAAQNCRFTHEKPNQRVMSDSRPAHERVYKRFEPPTKASLFVKLVQTDHDAEDEKLLDFIDYMYQKQLI